jgi:FlgD Ig-like domain
VPTSSPRLLLCFSLLALSLLARAPVVHGQIVLPGTQPNELQNWPLEKPSDCRTCHGDYVAGLDYEPFDSWAGSMMANAGRDPLFWAAVDIANQDSPGVGELCIRCHSPRGWLEGRSSTADGSALIGYLDEIDNDFDGIECHFCHRMYEGPTGTPFLQNGQYWVDDGTPTQEPPRRGPFQNAFAPHPWQYSTYTSSSEFCGTCHDLKSPLVQLLDENGVSTGLDFPEQLTYSEWANSDFATEGTECQDCHMPPASVNPAFACDSFNPPRPDVGGGDPAPVSRHDLIGANTFIPRVLDGEYGVALNRSAAYQATILRAEDMLKNQSATLVLTPPTWAVELDTMLVAVRVTNLTGHKLPTGYPEGRRMWIEMVATDALGVPFFSSGSYDTSTATLAADPQLRSYETEHGVEGEGTGFHLVRNNRIFSDTRIPPRGFRPVPGSEPVGRVYAQQPDSSLAYWDDVSYQVPVPAGVQGPVSVSATLRYQTASRPYVEFLRDQNVSGPDPKDRNYPSAPSRGQKIYDLWAQYGKSTPVAMVSDNATIAVTQAPANLSSLTATTGHNRVQLDWQLPPGAVGVKILRADWADYPEFGSVGTIAAIPVPQSRLSDALASGWVEVYDGAGTTHIDSTFANQSRTVVSYAAYTYDSNGVSSKLGVQSQTRATSYHLGDLGEVGVSQAYDGKVDGPKDLPRFSLAYGTQQGEAGFDGEVDIAPTDDGSRTGIPTPDDRVDFPDLVLFAQQFGLGTGAAKVPPVRSVDDTGPILVRSSVPKFSGERSVVDISVENARGVLRAMHLEWELPSGTRLIAIERAAALPVNSFVAPSRRGASDAADMAVLGLGAAVEIDGTVFRLVFAGELESFRLDVAIAAAANGEALEIELSSDSAPGAGMRRRLELSANIPNPFNPRTRVELRLRETSSVTAVIYDIAGRRVTELLRGELGPGTHELIWTGSDDRGGSVASGVYVLRVTAAGEIATRRMVLVR